MHYVNDDDNLQGFISLHICVSEVGNTAAKNISQLNSEKLFLLTAENETIKRRVETWTEGEDFVEKQNGFEKSQSIITASVFSAIYFQTKHLHVQWKHVIQTGYHLNIPQGIATKGKKNRSNIMPSIFRAVW